MAKKTTKDLAELGAVLESNGVVLGKENPPQKKELGTPPQPSPKGREEEKNDRFKNFSWENTAAEMVGDTTEVYLLKVKETNERLQIQNIVMCGMISDDPDHDAKFRKYTKALQDLYPNARIWNPVDYVPKMKRWMFPFQKLTNDMALIICLTKIYKLSRKEGFMLGILPDCITSLGGMAEWKMGQAMKCKIERLEPIE